MTFWPYESGLDCQTRSIHYILRLAQLFLEIQSLARIEWKYGKPRGWTHYENLESQVRRPVQKKLSFISTPAKIQQDYCVAFK